MFGFRYGLLSEDYIKGLELIEKANAAEPPQLPHPLRGAARHLPQDFIEQLSYDSTNP